MCRRILACLVVTLALGSALCQQGSLAVIEILPCPLNELKGASLTPTAANSSARNFSFCLWINVQSWSTTVSLVRTRTFDLSLLPYDKGYGSFLYNKGNKNSNTVHFQWRRFLSVSSMSWNSLCLTYNAELRQVAVVINGHLVNNVTLSKAEAIDKFDFPFIILATNHTFAARIADFNAWSRALTMEEIQGLVSRKDPSLTTLTRPDIFDWKNLSSIKFRTNCTRWIQVDPGIIDLYNARDRYPEIVSTNASLTLEEAFRVCERLNSEMFYPRSTRHLDLTRNLTSKENFEACGNRFWVPFRKVDTKWFTFSRNLPLGGSTTFEPWGKEETDREGECSYFDLATNRFYESECNDRFCGFCEVPQERLIFDLKSEC